MYYQFIISSFHQFINNYQFSIFISQLILLISSIPQFLISSTRSFRYNFVHTSQNHSMTYFLLLISSIPQFLISSTHQFISSSNHQFISSSNQIKRLKISVIASLKYFFGKYVKINLKNKKIFLSLPSEKD